MLSRALTELVRITTAHPTTRKRLVSHDLNHARELLTSLTRVTGGWIGWEPATLRGIADALAFVPLHAAGVRVGSDLEIEAVLDTALDTVLRSDAGRSHLHGVQVSPGFRVAVRDAVLKLRVAGVDAVTLDRAAPAGRPTALLVPVLAAYDTLLRNAGLADAATIFQFALTSFESEAPFVLDGGTWCVRLHDARGLPGALLQRLRAAGAIDVLVDEPTPEDDRSAAPRSVLAWAGSDQVPDDASTACDRTLVGLTRFSATSPTEELREVCRRVLAAGLRWDDVELVTADPDTYGIALDSLARTLNLTVSMHRGLPFFATRLGRVLSRWFAWLESDLDARLLRVALESGDFRSPDPAVSAALLARELRTLEVGWGRDRYQTVVATLEQADAVASSPEQRALHQLLVQLLDVTPPVPSREATDDGVASIASLALATVQVLGLTDLPDDERASLERVVAHLTTLSDSVAAPTTFRTALACVRASLTGLRAWPAMTSPTERPARAQGGAMHLTDFASCGATHRSHTFVVGLDVERMNGMTAQDPLLPDSVQRRLGASLLADSATRRTEQQRQVVRGLAGLRGSVTLSYATRQPDGSPSAPAPLLLQILRLQRRDASLSFEDLRASLQPSVGAVPPTADRGTPGALLDARDVWFSALATLPTSMDATPKLRVAWPSLARGLMTAELAGGSVVTGAHGLVQAAGKLAPTQTGAAVSASSLEMFGACGLRWFYARALQLSVPVDMERDESGWLDAAQRGTLLHEIFARFVSHYLHRQSELHDDAAAEAMRELVEQRVAVWIAAVPPSDASAMEVERADAHRAAHAFLTMERAALLAGDRASWSDVEVQFGARVPVRYVLDDGREILLRGTADRVDTYSDSAVRIVDYKSGNSARYEMDPKRGPLNGGRLLQPAIYSAAISAAQGREVRAFEYRFPTDRGANTTVLFDAEAHGPARAVVSSIIGDMERGRFLPTIDANECKYCDFAAVCRVSSDRWALTSARAAWSDANLNAAPELSGVRARNSLSVSESEG
jgi:ATP-dependent helicase/nuclease subunit B